MQLQSIMNNWSFCRGIPGYYPTSDKVQIDLPHDMQIGIAQSPEADGAAGHFPGCAGTYEKMVDIPAEWQGQRVYVSFDGVYGRTTVSVNGSRLYFHPYGYTPFLVDITRYVEFGAANRLEVAVDNTEVTNSRWYSGAGIFREVSLIHAPLVHIRHNGIELRTESIDWEADLATVSATVYVTNGSGLPFHGYVDLSLMGPDRSLVTVRTSVWADAGETVPARIRFVVPHPDVWDQDHPALYRADSALFAKGTEDLTAGACLDTASTRFGIRTVAVDAVHGLRVNGKTVKLKGGCVHHTTSPLGAADFESQARRLLRAHKDAGFNAIRTAHNPPSAQFLNLCDEYGIFVIDEAFDGWHVNKTPHDYGLFFDDWWERDVTSYIERDINHPCVVIWSIGNEVFERSGVGDGYLLSRKLAEKVRSLDASRPTLLANCSLWNGLSDKDKAEAARRRDGDSLQNANGAYVREIWADRTESLMAPVDICGYNYMEDRYEEDHKHFPNRVICGTESFPLQIDRMWDLVMRNDHVIGDFTWTSAEYIGEAGIGSAVYTEPGVKFDVWARRPYPWKLAYDSDWDILLQPRPQLAYRKIVWGACDTYLAVRDPANYGKEEHLTPWAWPMVWNSWTWPGYEGKPIAIDVYSAGDSVELSLNGKSLGVQPTSRFTASFETVYAPGTLEAVSYRDGQEISRDKLETAGAPVRLVIRPEQNDTGANGGKAAAAAVGSVSVPANGRSLIFALIEFEDADGRRVPGLRKELTATVTGAARLQSFASANPITDENYEGSVITTYNGQAMAILRAGHEAGTATLTVSCEGFEPAVLEFRIG